MIQFAHKTIKDINIKNKTILLRSDFNVPISSDSKVSGDFRIRQALPTIEYLIENNCRVIICSHLGRPEGKVDSRFTLAPVAQELKKLLNRKISFATDCIGQVRTEKQKTLKSGEILLLENLRFYPEEEANDKEFAAKLAEGIDVFVQDGFGVVHRKHASTDAITKHLPSVAGLLLEKEVTTITNAMHNPKKPLMAIVGGAKIADKIGILRLFIKHADFVAVGGAMANTFLHAQRIDVGKSLIDNADVPLAKTILEEAKAESKKRPFTFYLPQDGVVASKIDSKAETRIVDWDAHAIAEIENYPRRAPISSGRVADDERILDIGPFSGAFIAGSMQFCNTVIWNGVMGVTETHSVHGPVGPFAHGTEIIMEAMFGEFGHKPFSLIGGGDTSSYVESRDMVEFFNHVSTGGGASLELMEGRKLPGIEALQKS